MKVFPAVFWANRARKPTGHAFRRQSYRPELERLEDRLAPATHIWTGAAALKFGNIWSANGNWTGGVPTTGEAGGTIVQFNSGSTSLDNILFLVIDQLHFTAGGNTILGPGPVTLGIDDVGNDGMVNDTGNNSVDTSLPLNLTNSISILVSAGELTIASAISGDNLDLMLDSGSDAGTLQLAGSVTNSYGGATLVEAGTLLLNNNLVHAAIPGSLLIGGGVVRWQQDNQLNGVDMSVATGGQSNLNGHSDTIRSLIMDGGTVTTGTGTLTLNGDVMADSSAGTAASISGNLNLGTATRKFNVSNIGGGTVNLDISAVISGDAGGGVETDGTGAIRFDGPSDNTYSGTTTVNAGTLELDSRFVAIPGALVIGDGQGGPNTAIVLDLSFSQLFPTAPVTINSDGLLDVSSIDKMGSLRMTGGAVDGGELVLGGNLTATSDGAGNPATIASVLKLDGATRTFTVNSGPGAVQLDISDPIVNGGTTMAGLTKAGSGTFRLSGANDNTYDGATTVDAGTLVLNNSKGMAVPGALFIGSANGAAGTALVRLTMPNQINPMSVVQIQDAGRLDLNNLAQTIGRLNVLGANFAFAQLTTADAGGAHTGYTFTIDGAATQTYPNTVLTNGVLVTGTAASNTAILSTNDTYKDTNGATQETRESISLGSKSDPGAGTLQKFDANGNPFTFLTLNKFPTSYAYVGRNDGTVQLFGTAGVTFNGFVSAGNYSYIGGPGLFHLVQGATSVYGYSAGQATDFAYHYAANAGSAFVVSGVAFSYMSAMDTVGGVTESFFNVAVGFLVNTGVSKNPGQDFAYIIDSPGNDTFVGGDTSSYMFSTGGNGNFTEFDTAYGFALVFAQSFVGGTDTATNSDPTRNILVGFRLQ